MLKKPTLLLLLFALCMWAADFWTTKPFTEWNDKEVSKILTDSPWSAKVTVGGGPPAFTGSDGRSGGGGGGGGRGGRGGGPQGDAATADPGIDGGGGFGGGGGGGA